MSCRLSHREVWSGVGFAGAGASRLIGFLGNRANRLAPLGATELAQA
jgi:hypothetical protein